MNVILFHAACRDVLQHANGGFADYAKAYAQAGLRMSDCHEIKVQCLYILNNLSHWRGDKAKQVKLVLRSFK